MDAQIRQTLANLGLGDIEIQIYLYTLQNGASTQQEIAEKTGLLRQTIYDRVRIMESKGIISRTNKDSKPLFVAVPPKIFLEQLKEKEEQVKNTLPLMEELSKLSQNPTTSTTFSGLKALKRLMQITLTTKEEILWIANKKVSDKIFTDYFWHNFAARRKEKDISIRLLIETNPTKEWETNKKEGRLTRTHSFVNSQKSSMVVFGDQILLYTTSEDNYTGTQIVDKHLAQFFRELFEKLWKEGKEIK